MNNNAWFKKEIPLQTVIGFGGGATGFGAHSSALSKLYVDDVFSTYLWKGNDTSRSINNGIDLSGKGGLTWIKSRSDTESHWWFDTDNGADWALRSNLTNARYNTGSPYMSAFNSNGFSVGTHDGVNDASQEYSSWTFRKAKGFCDIVTWTGNGTNRTIAHNLGSVPGMMIVKCTNQSRDWTIYHQGVDPVGNSPESYRLKFYISAKQTNAAYWHTTKPTSTHISLGSSNQVNETGDTYVAYLFAGGDSQNIDITSKTVTNLGGNFDGSYPMSKLTDGIATTNNTNFGYVSNANGMIDVYVDLTSSHVITNYKIAPQGDASANECYNIPTKFEVYGTNDTSSWTLITTSQVGYAGWRAGVYQHFPIPLTSGYRYWRIKVLENKNTDGTNGGGSGISEWKMDGYSASSESLEYKFGENEDQNLISCGSYIGNGNVAGPEILLGWEPSWVMIKNSSSSGSGWMMYDSMRGWFNEAEADRYIMANETNAETTFDLGYPTSRGYNITTDNSSFNTSGDNYVYMAIRRPDALAGKPPSAGTGAFAMDNGNTSTTIPNYISEFPVGFALLKNPGSSTSWDVASRLTGTKYLKTDTNNAEATFSDYTFDSNTGWAKDNGPGTMQSWMWKRGQGFDVVAYKGDGVSGRDLNHSLGINAPEMIWIKNRSSSGNTGDWMVGHKDLNGGSSPWNYYLVLNKNQGEYSDNNPFNNSAPTTTSFQLDSWDRVNASGSNYLALLFATANDADGNPISKVGYYSGNGQTGSNGRFVSTGFTPRFILIKNINQNGNDWWTHDSLRGMDKAMALDQTAAQATQDYLDISSTGFRITSSYVGYNASGDNYIYYAHA